MDTEKEQLSPEHLVKIGDEFLTSATNPIFAYKAGFKAGLKGFLDIRREQYEEFAGDWNGEDDKFISGGELFNEEDAQLASDIVEKIDELKELFKEFNDR